MHDKISKTEKKLSLEDKLIQHYEQLLNEKNNEIFLLKRKLRIIRKTTKDLYVKRLTHYPPHDE